MRALLIFHAPTDDIVGIDNATRIFVAAKHPKSFVSIAGADHLLTRAEDAGYVASVLAAWAARYVPELVQAARPWADPLAGAECWHELLETWLSQLAAELPPELEPRLIPLNLDAPDHGKYRLPLMRAFSPDRMRALEPHIRAFAIELIEAVADHICETLFLQDDRVLAVTVKIIKLAISENGEKIGITTIGIGIEEDVTAVYNQAVNIKSVEDLGVVSFKQIKLAV